MTTQAIGFGGDSMLSALDYIICEVKDTMGGDVECIDRQSLDRSEGND